MIHLPPILALGDGLLTYAALLAFGTAGLLTAFVMCFFRKSNGRAIAGFAVGGIICIVMGVISPAFQTALHLP